MKKQKNVVLPGWLSCSAGGVLFEHDNKNGYKSDWALSTGL